MFRKPLAFIKKDFLIESSYKLAFLLNIFAILISILTYFFIDRLFGHRMVSHLEEFGVNYFSYVLLSMAFFSYIGVGLGSFSSRIRQEQMQGTLEAIILTPTKISTILISLVFWNLCFATFNMAVYILFGILLFKINLDNINLLSTAVISLLTITSFASIGILSASFIIVLKRGNPISWFINTMQGLIGGVYFPITVMPGWLQLLTKFFPIAYAIRAIELSVYKGFSLTQLTQEIGFLILFSAL